MDLIEGLLDVSIIEEVKSQGERKEVLFIIESSWRSRIRNPELVMMIGN